jgi:hypothetical protein
VTTALAAQETGQEVVAGVGGLGAGRIRALRQQELRPFEQLLVDDGFVGGLMAFAVERIGRAPSSGIWNRTDRGLGTAPDTRPPSYLWLRNTVNTVVSRADQLLLGNLESDAVLGAGRIASSETGSSLARRRCGRVRLRSFKP